nr:helix-turn-helix domain-containing protein [Cohnella fermenti]
MQAKRLLVSTPLSVKEIALGSGFSQSSYFISCFRRTEGMTPSQFRSLYRPGAE